MYVSGCIKVYEGEERQGRRRVPLPFPWTKAPNCHVCLWHLTPMLSIGIDTGQRNHPRNNRQMRRDLRGGKAAIGSRWLRTLRVWYIPHLASSRQGPPGRREMERILYLGWRWQGGSALREGRSAPLSPSTPCSTLLGCKEMLPPHERVTLKQGISLGFFWVCVCFC